jgi:hypothetical protein
MAQGFTQSLTDTSTRKSFFGVKRDRCVRLSTSPPSWADCVENVRSSTSNNPLGLHGLIQGYAYFFLVKCVFWQVIFGNNLFSKEHSLSRWGEETEAVFCQHRFPYRIQDCAENAVISLGETDSLAFRRVSRFRDCRASGCLANCQDTATPCHAR